MEDINIAKKDVVSQTNTKEQPNLKKPTHPTIGTMVDTAISTLNERGGSSLPAIKKYLKSNFYVDSVKMASYIRKYIKNSVVSGHLIQTKGRGASGSFKLTPASTKDKNKKASVKKSDKKPTKSTVVAMKKSAKKTGEKAPVEKKTKQKEKKMVGKQAKAPKQPKSVKAIKPVKTAAVKPKPKKITKKSKQDET